VPVTFGHSEVPLILHNICQTRQGLTDGRSEFIYKIVTGWLVTFHSRRSFAENRFLQADNGAENTKEKIQAVIYEFSTRGLMIFKILNKIKNNLICAGVTHVL
jgi:hypothetical protein